MVNEQWFCVNLTTKSFTVGIAGTPSLTKYSQFDLLLYTDKNTACTSSRLLTLLANRQIEIKKYRDELLFLTVNHSNYQTSLCEVEPPSGNGVQLYEYSTVESPSEGMLAYDFFNHKPKVYDGTAWKDLTS